MSHPRPEPTDMRPSLRFRAAPGFVLAKAMPMTLAMAMAAGPVLFPTEAADGAEGANGPDKPNFVVIFVDDLGYGDIGPYGATKQRTPRLDRMAAEGMKLTSFYAAPVCSVSRAQLLTGCYGARISVPGVYFPGHANGLNPAEATVAERLRALGYATACVGKWHVGDQPEFLPTRQGFDRYLGIPYSNDMQRPAAGTREPVVPLVRDEIVAELLTDEAQRGIVAAYTEEAIDFIRDSRDRPFFLYLPHSAVHTPIYPGEAFAGRSANGRFGDWVEEIDWSTGRLLDTLAELGLDEKTLVIFTSDNGPWLVKGADGGSAGPLRGGKGSTWEGGVRVPTVVRWPGRIPAGSASDAVAGTIDLLPTFVSLAGGAVPAEPAIDGRDLSAVLLGRTAESPREAHYYFAGYQLQAVRQGPWKLALAPQPESMGKQTATDASGKEPRLYHLGNEIAERTDVAAAHPEIVARLRGLAEAMSAEIGGQAPRARRPAGSVEQPKTLYPTDATPRPAGKKAASKRVAPGTLKPGEAIPSAAAPRVDRQPFAIRCTVETEQSDAILVAHGGTAVGYALRLKGGRAAFLIRRGGVTEIEAPLAGAGPIALDAVLAADGTMRLSVNGRVAATGKAPGLLDRQPQEDFCIGFDNGNPVTPEPVPGTFRGRLTGLTIGPP